MEKAVSGLTIRERKILLVRKNGKWILPGGKIEQKESDIECLCREFQEELPGTKIEDIRYYNSFRGKAPHKKYSIKMDVYFVDISENIGRVSKEIDSAEWVENFSDYNISGITKKIINKAVEDKYL